MSRLNTMYPNDEFLKDISNVIGKVDSKNETQIKKEIEQVGYKEFYRYYKEKDIYIKQLQQENSKYKEVIDKAIKCIDYNTKYIKQLQQENQKLKIQISAKEEVANKYKEVIDKAIEYIESKNNGYCIKNGEEKGAFTFLLDFDKAREFIWKLLEILNEVE